MLVLLATVAACGGSAEDALEVFADDGGGRPDDRRDDDRRDQETEVDIADMDTMDPADRDDAIIEATLAEIETFWAGAFPEVYGDEFVPVQGGFFAYGPDREPVPCGEPPPTYEQVAGNAFYCPGDDLIAWDTDNLTNGLLATFGPFSLVLVMAHEYGHAIQARSGFDRGLPTIAGEQDADCVAGAFTGYLADGGSDVLSVSEDDLDGAVAGFLTLRDQVGTPADDPLAHGSAFDRVGAFQDGFDQGVSRCAEYEDIFLSGESTAVNLEFQSQEDFTRGGDAPFDPAVDDGIFELSLTSLELYWETVFPDLAGERWDPIFPDRVTPFFPSEASTLPEECGGEEISAEVAEERGAFVCEVEPDDPDADTVAWDLENLMPNLYDEIGDFAVGTVIGQLYATAVQRQLGAETDGVAASLQADCYTGAWAGSLFFAERLPPVDPNDPEDTRTALSAGDLDESVQSFLTAEDRGADRGTAFERVAAFRAGFLNDLSACADLADGEG